MWSGDTLRDTWALSVGWACQPWVASYLSLLLLVVEVKHISHILQSFWSPDVKCYESTMHCLFFALRNIIKRSWFMNGNPLNPQIPDIRAKGDAEDSAKSIVFSIRGSFILLGLLQVWRSLFMGVGDSCNTLKHPAVWNRLQSSDLANDSSGSFLTLVCPALCSSLFFCSKRDVC